MMSVSKRVVISKHFGWELLEHIRRVSLLVQKDFEIREKKFMVRLDAKANDVEVQAAIKSSFTDLSIFMNNEVLETAAMDANQFGPLVGISNE